MTSFSIDLGDETATALREIAEVTDETPDTLIRRAIEELVADYIDGRIAMQRLADPSDEIISSAELRRRLAEDDSLTRIAIAPGPAGIVALAVSTLADVPVSERDLLLRKLGERER
jgi:predicted DNA-binding protein